MHCALLCVGTESGLLGFIPGHVHCTSGKIVFCTNDTIVKWPCNIVSNQSLQRVSATPQSTLDKSSCQHNLFWVWHLRARRFEPSTPVNLYYSNIVYLCLCPYHYIINTTMLDKSDVFAHILTIVLKNILFIVSVTAHLLAISLYNKHYTTAWTFTQR